MSRWKRALGFAAGKAVLAWARAQGVEGRPLSERERAVLAPIYAGAVDYDAVRLCERIGGVLNVSRRAFVIEQRIFVPPGFSPLPRAVLVHEVCHVWQFQHGGHAYLADSLHAQLVGEGYELARALAAGCPWPRLNCEQQATLLEEAFLQGCFEGRPFVFRGADYTRLFEDAVAALRRGEGASFR